MCQHGVASAARVFSKRLDKHVSESTVLLMQESYKEGLQRKRSAKDSEFFVLPLKKCRRHVLLEERLDKMVQLYLREVREGGGTVSTQMALEAAHAMIAKCDRAMFHQVWWSFSAKQTLGPFTPCKNEVCATSSQNLQE